MAHSEILCALPDLESRLTHAITDATFPYRNALRDAAWLLKNPNVCKTSFEGLVGPLGGGSRELQLRQTKELMAHLQAPGDPELLVDQLYDTESRTFHTGQIGGRRDTFTEEHEALFARHFAETLKLFGCDAE